MECEFARPPSLRSENETAWELWLAVQTQWRGAGLGVIGLDYRAVAGEAHRLGIDLNPAVMNKIRALEQAVLEQQAERIEARQRERAQKGRKQHA